MDNNELMHHGVPGMKWGVRRYQNRDGTLTAAGRKRYQKELAKLREEAKVVKNKEQTKAKFDQLAAKRAALDERKKALKGKSPDDDKSANSKTPKKAEPKEKRVDPREKSVDQMSDAELKSAVDRLVLENQYQKLNPPTVSRGKRFMQVVGKDVVAPAMVSAGKKALEKALGSAFDAAFDKVGEQAKKASNTTKKAAEKAKDDAAKEKPKSKGKAYQTPQADFKETWVNDDSWWNTPAASSTAPALPAPDKKKKKRK